jgi:hypothetical protein
MFMFDIAKCHIVFWYLLVLLPPAMCSYISI